VAVAEEEQERGEQDGEGEDAEQGGGEPSPDGEGKALPGHAFAAELDDGGEGVDGAEGGGDGEEAMLASQRSMPSALAGAGERRGGERRVGCPAADGRAAGDEEGGEEGESARAVR
jgi:hypothetical protein